MRLSVEHTTGFHYASPVASSYNEARMVPVRDVNQTVWDSRVRIEPSPCSFTYVDYWGTRVTAFELHQPHQTLTVTAFGIVETTGDGEPWDSEDVPNSDLGWAELADPAVTSSMSEFLVLSKRTEPSDELRALARGAAVNTTPRMTALAICGLVADHLTYERDTPIGGESHSWVEWWCGSWVAYDPTMSGRITDSYVRIGHGRDYGDVTPLRGTYAGAARRCSSPCR